MKVSPTHCNKHCAQSDVAVSYLSHTLDQAQLSRQYVLISSDMYSPPQYLQGPAQIVYQEIESSWERLEGSAQTSPVTTQPKFSLNKTSLFCTLYIDAKEMEPVPLH